MARGNRIVVEFAGDTSKLDAAFAKVKSGSSGLEKGLKGLAGAAAVGMITAQIGDAIQAATDLNESMSKSAAVFGEHAAAIDAWAQQGAEDFGLSKQAALEAASTFGNMFSQLGVGSQHAAQLSQNITELAADFASFHNADISQVIQAQSAAFRGEYDALQRFLPLINAATVEQRAMEMTGKNNAKALTAQEKALAVNNLMFEGAGKAMGDFDRTADSAANQQRILAANIENTQAIIGQKLQPVMQDVLQWLNSDGIPGFLKLTEVIGEGMADAAAFAIGALADFGSGIAQVLEKVDQFVPGLEGVPEQMQLGVTELRRMEAGLHDVQIEMEFATGAAADHAASQQVAAKAIKGTGEAAATSAKAVTTLKDAQLDARGADLALEQSTYNLAKAQDAYNKFLETGGIDMEKVKQAQEDLTKAQKDVEKATRDVAKAQEAVNEALKPVTQRQIGKAARDVAGAQDDVTTAELNLKDAQDEYLRVTNDRLATDEDKKRAQIAVGEALRAVQDAEDNLADAQTAQTEVQKIGTTQSDAYKTASENLKTAEDGLKTATDNQTAAQNALNTAQAQSETYAEDLWKVTNDLKTAELDLDQKTWGAQKAQTALKTAMDETKTSTRDLWANVVGLKDDLASGWVIDPTLRGAGGSWAVLPSSSIGPSGLDAWGNKVGPGWATGRAAGGPVRAGSPYLVGEMGPELFVPKRSGTIVPNGEAGGGITVVVNGALDPAAVARQIEQVLTSYKRSGGNLRFN
jgi:hypothetical protein